MRIGGGETEEVCGLVEGFGGRKVVWKKLVDEG